MRLKKGSKVELLKKSYVPPGSWWCAEFVSGNGHTYNVKYNQPPSNISEMIMERIPRKAIRPCLPPFEGAESWVSGDIMEVFEMSSRKLAEVSRVVSRNHYFVRLLGSSSEFKVHKSFIRVQQSWKDEISVLIGKDLGKLNNDKLIRPPKAGDSPMSGFQLPLSDESMKGCPGDDHYPIEKCIPSDECSCRKKRGPPW